MEINYYRQDNAQGYEEAWSSCLFASANDIFSLSTVRDVTTVRHISGYDLHILPDQSQFQFTIDPIPSSNDSKESNEVKESSEGKVGSPCHGSAVTTSKLPQCVNNSLTLSTHPQSVAACPVGGDSAAIIPSGNQPCHGHANPNPNPNND